MLNDKQIFLLGKDTFTKHIDRCLKEDSLDTDIGLRAPDYPLDIAIITFFKLNKSKEEQLDRILKSKVKKIILIENGLDLYLNSKNNLPFSVYTKVIPKNEICERYLEIEQKVIESKKQYVIFRASEIYGLSMPGSLIERLLFATSGEFENSTRDFIYDGDVISAIEIALRKDVAGIFDIASGHSVDLRKLVELVKRVREDEFELSWRRKRVRVVFNCENFKFYKWEPLVNLELGMKTLLMFRRKYGKLQSTRNFRRADF